MCRLLGYLGPSVQLDQLILKPAHSLVVQSYAPKELNEALLNADGYGLGWYHPTASGELPYTYRSALPIWNDANLEPLCRYITTQCGIAYVRSATIGQGVNVQNCQPFQFEQLLFAHNGYIKSFHETLYRPMRQAMSDRVYPHIMGTTDSEHLFGLILTAWLERPQRSLVDAVAIALQQTMALAHEYDTPVAANILISDGTQLIGSRLASHRSAPSLYWLKDDPQFPDAVLVASEPLFDGQWQTVPNSSLFTLQLDCDVQFHSFDRDELAASC